MPLAAAACTASPHCLETRLLPQENSRLLPGAWLGAPLLVVVSVFWVCTAFWKLGGKNTPALGPRAVAATDCGEAAAWAGRRHQASPKTADHSRTCSFCLGHWIARQGPTHSSRSGLRCANVLYLWRLRHRTERLRRPFGRGKPPTFRGLSRPNGLVPRRISLVDERTAVWMLLGGETPGKHRWLSSGCPRCLSTPS